MKKKRGDREDMLLNAARQCPHTVSEKASRRDSKVDILFYPCLRICVLAAQRSFWRRAIWVMKSLGRIRSQLRAFTWK